MTANESENVHFFCLSIDERPKKEKDCFALISAVMPKGMFRSRVFLIRDPSDISSSYIMGKLVAKGRLRCVRGERCVRNLTIADAYRRVALELTGQYANDVNAVEEGDLVAFYNVDIESVPRDVINDMLRLSAGLENTTFKFFFLPMYKRDLDPKIKQLPVSSLVRLQDKDIINGAEEVAEVPHDQEPGRHQDVVIGEGKQSPTLLSSSFQVTYQQHEKLINLKAQRLEQLTKSAFFDICCQVVAVYFGPHNRAVLRVWDGTKLSNVCKYGFEVHAGQDSGEDFIVKDETLVTEAGNFAVDIYVYDEYIKTLNDVKPGDFVNVTNIRALTNYCASLKEIVWTFTLHGGGFRRGIKPCNQNSIGFHKLKNDLETFRRKAASDISHTDRDNRIAIPKRNAKISSCGKNTQNPANNSVSSAVNLECVNIGNDSECVRRNKDTTACIGSGERNDSAAIPRGSLHTNCTNIASAGSNVLLNKAADCIRCKNSQSNPGCSSHQSITSIADIPSNADSPSNILCANGDDGRKYSPKRIKSLKVGFDLLYNQTTSAINQGCKVYGNGPASSKDLSEAVIEKSCISRKLSREQNPCWSDINKYSNNEPKTSTPAVRPCIDADKVSCTESPTKNDAPSTKNIMKPVKGDCFVSSSSDPSHNESCSSVLEWNSLKCVSELSRCIKGLNNICSVTKVLQSPCPAIFRVKWAVVDIQPRFEDVDEIVQWKCNDCKEMFSRSCIEKLRCGSRFYCCYCYMKDKRVELTAYFVVSLHMFDKDMKRMTVKIDGEDAVGFFCGITPEKMYNDVNAYNQLRNILKLLCPKPGSISPETTVLHCYLFSKMSPSCERTEITYYVRHTKFVEM